MNNHMLILPILFFLSVFVAGSFKRNNRCEWNGTSYHCTYVEVWLKDSRS